MADLTLELENITPDQAMALAQFVKRVGYQELRSNASGDQEADRMQEAFSRLQDALDRAGYAPR